MSLDRENALKGFEAWDFQAQNLDALCAEFLGLLTQKHEDWKLPFYLLEAARILSPHVVTAEGRSAWFMGLLKALFYSEDQFFEHTLCCHPEPRVRQAVSRTLKLICQQGFAAEAFGQAQPFLTQDIEERMSHRVDAKKESPVWEIPKAMHDTEGWRTLETSVLCLQALIEGAGNLDSFSAELFGLMETCATHLNRYVREAAFKTFRSLLDFSQNIDAYGNRYTHLIREGLQDPWSQVRFAASTAARSLVKFSEFIPQVLPQILINRHYVAEGVRLYSRETWQLIFPQGGRATILARFDEFQSALEKSAVSNNHAVREAVAAVMAELVRIVSVDRAERLLPLLEGFLEDGSWPVRDAATVALTTFREVYPKLSYGMMEECFLFDGLVDSIPIVRKHSARALVAGEGPKLEDLLEICRLRIPLFDEPENPDIAPQYMASGPFNILCENQEQYSCGSLAPKFFDHAKLQERKQRRRKELDPAGGCMNCCFTSGMRKWEVSQGAVFLLAELLTRLAASKEAPDLLANIQAEFSAVVRPLCTADFPARPKYMLELKEYVPILERELSLKFMD